MTVRPHKYMIFLEVHVGRKRTIVLRRVLWKPIIVVWAKFTYSFIGQKPSSASGQNGADTCNIEWAG